MAREELLAREDKARDAAVREYAVIANEVEGGPLRAQSLPVVLATAIGAFPGDPLTAILEEIEHRCGTLGLVAQTRGPEVGDALDSLTQELAMLRTRASVALEIVHRLGLSGGGLSSRVGPFGPDANTQEKA